MTAFKCKMCGGTLELFEGATVAKCKYCGTTQTLPRLTNDRRVTLYERANHFRRNNEFDKAMGIYEIILNEDITDAEAYWSLVLCRYGIEYVEDPASQRHIPTVNRAQYTSIYDDDNYRSALQYADKAQRQVYEDEAKIINDIQKNILAISEKEAPFDVFICYKETDQDGQRTPDSVLAQELYDDLKDEGLKVFFSRITLEDKLGAAYEPYIFAALNSAKVMVVIGTHPDHFNAVWVKNEWSRFLALIGQGQKKTLIPAYRDMDPYDMPEEFSHLQAQDMAKLGFMQDLVRGIKKIVKAANTPKAAVIRETVNVQTAVDTSPLLQRAFLFLEDGDWAKADEFLEQILNREPQNAQAYVGKLMAELHVKKQAMLENSEKPFDENNNYLKAVRFASPALKTELEGYIERIRARNEQAMRESIRLRKKRTKKLALILTPLLCLLLAGAAVMHAVVLPMITPSKAGMGATKHAHAFDIWTTVTDATCTENGLQKRVCRPCGEEQTREIPALGHTPITDPAVAPTENESGLTEGSHCSVCAQVLVAQEVIPSLFSQGLDYQIVNNKTVTITGMGTCTDTALRIPAEIEGLPVTEIGDSAFINRVELISVVIPEGVTRIGNSAFSYCQALRQIILPDSIVEIDPFAFLGVANPGGTIYENVYYLGTPSNPYMYLHSPVEHTSTEITIHPDTKVLAAYAFQQMPNLTSIIIPEGIQELPDDCFFNCPSLKTVTIPKSVKVIRDDVFAKSNCLTTVYYTGTEEEWAAIHRSIGNEILNMATVICNHSN